HLVAGALFAVLFHAGGIARIDGNAAQGSWGFRAIITPGVVLLWPLLLRRWWRATGVPPVPRDAHRDAARAGSGR
ncbi:MAG TPA: hypothetical protein VLC53_13090, partial [Myxococcota bacterium]|nr:hypothetical protein [Myxococcota bacterium]